MDDKTVADVTRALDVTITKVARKQLKWLSSGLSPSEIADQVHLSLRSLERLSRGGMPCYDAWDALFYSVWYQTAHINLAYTLARKMPKDQNPLRSGRGSLQVVDFGCGALAMQFGLALAAADALRKQRRPPNIAIVSEDSSQNMKRIGWAMWDRFVMEIADKKKYPNLNALRQVCTTMKFGDQGRPTATRWLTALHVAYEENAAEVKKAIDTHVKNWKPDLIVVTTHPQNAEELYSPRPSAVYGKYDKKEIQPKYRYDGRFQKTTKFRSDLYSAKINAIDSLCRDDRDFVRKYLTWYPTEWVTPKFESKCFFYVKS